MAPEDKQAFERAVATDKSAAVASVLTRLVEGEIAAAEQTEKSEVTAPAFSTVLPSQEEERVWAGGSGEKRNIHLRQCLRKEEVLEP